MDSRKVSSLSVKSDGSDSSLRSGTNLVLEKLDTIPVSEAEDARRLTSCGSLLCSLLGESQVFVLEVKLRADSDCAATRRAVLALPGARDERRYLDAGLFQVAAGEYRLALLAERKNKERFVSVLELVTSGRALSLGEELAVYDKASMLGKGLSHVAAFPGGANGEADLLTFSNIVRKLKVEEGGGTIKPTSGRVPVPPECTDGTISVSVAESKKGFTIIASFKTKSAGKNKFQVNWFQGRKDEIGLPTGKSAIKLPEDQEPSVILIDPRDARSAFVICNHSPTSSSISKLVRGRKLEDTITTFPHSIQEAAFVCGPDKSLFLVVLEGPSLCLGVYHLTKTEGYRGMQAVWSTAPEVQDLTCFFHAISCSQHKWQLPPKIVDFIVSSRCEYQVGLATLLQSRGDIAVEPESGLQYRIRILGGDSLNDALVILLDDLERVFESEEESLASMSLKICLNSPAGREGLSQVSGWLMAGRLSSVEVYSLRLDSDSGAGSDRLAMHTLSADVFRSYLIEQDWTQNTKKEGTFVLDSQGDTGFTPAAIRTSTPRRPSSSRSQGSRIPSANSSCNRRSIHLDTNPSPSSSNPVSLNGSECSSVNQVITRVEETIAPLARANAQIRESLEELERNLILIKATTNTATNTATNSIISTSNTLTDEELDD